MGEPSLPFALSQSKPVLGLSKGARRLTHLRARRTLQKGETMADWTTCPEVERDPERASGAWVFAGTRVPVSALFENLKDGATVQQFLEWFPGVDRTAVEAVLAFEMQSLADAPKR